MLTIPLACSLVAFFLSLPPPPRSPPSDNAPQHALTLSANHAATFGHVAENPIPLVDSDSGSHDDNDSDNDSDDDDDNQSASEDEDDISGTRFAIRAWCSEVMDACSGCIDERLSRASCGESKTVMGEVPEASNTGNVVLRLAIGPRDMEDVGTAIICQIFARVNQVCQGNNDNAAVTLFDLASNPAMRLDISGDPAYDAGGIMAAVIQGEADDVQSCVLCVCVCVCVCVRACVK